MTSGWEYNYWQKSRMITNVHVQCTRIESMCTDMHVRCAFTQILLWWISIWEWRGEQGHWDSASSPLDEILCVVSTLFMPLWRWGLEVKWGIWFAITATTCCGLQRKINYLHSYSGSTCTSHTFLLLFFPTLCIITERECWWREGRR